MLTSSAVHIKGTKRWWRRKKNKNPNPQRILLLPPTNCVICYHYYVPPNNKNCLILPLTKDPFFTMCIICQQLAISKVEKWQKKADVALVQNGFEGIHFIKKIKCHTTLSWAHYVCCTTCTHLTIIINFSCKATMQETQKIRDIFYCTYMKGNNLQKIINLMDNVDIRKLQRLSFYVRLIACSNII